MSQHDFNIANQTFPSFRADLNNALQAAATISAGATAPTTPYAYQLWFDTSTNTYKARNAANSAWISLFGNDLTNAGITFGDNDKAIFGAGSDLQIFHDGSNSFIDDAGTGVLAIRSNSISLGKYTGENLASFVADGAATLYYDNSAKIATTATGANIAGNIELYNDDIDGYIWFHDAGTRSWSVGSDQSTGNFAITNQSNLASGHMLEINSSGSVGIGGSPVSLLTVDKGNVTGAGQWASSAVAIANPTNIGAYSQISFGYTPATTNASAYIGYLSTNQGAYGYGDLVFGTRAVNTDTQPTERLRILSTGGITFNGDTAAANALDDYEEGTWTPTNPSGFAAGATYYQQFGYYTKIGNQVFVDFYIQFNVATGNGGLIQVGGLPFTLASNNKRGGGLSTYQNITNNTWQFYGSSGSNAINAYFDGSTAAGTSASVNNLFLIGCYTYLTA